MLQTENRPRPHVFTHGLHQVPSEFRAAPDNKAVTSCNMVCTRCTWHTVSETQWPPVTRRSNTHPQVKHTVRPGVLKCAITHYKAGRWDKRGRIWSGSVCEHFTHGWPAPVSVAASQLFWSGITSALWPVVNAALRIFTRTVKEWMAVWFEGLKNKNEHVLFFPPPKYTTTNWTNVYYLRANTTLGTSGSSLQYSKM